MKTLRLLLFVFAVALTAVSCSEEDDGFAGKYQTSYAKVEVYNGDVKLMGEEYKTIDELKENEAYMQFELKVGGGTAEFNEETQKWEDTAETWTETETEIIISSSNSTTTMKKNGSTLIWLQNWDEYDEELDATYTYDVEMHFTKM